MDGDHGITRRGLLGGGGGAAIALACAGAPGSVAGATAPLRLPAGIPLGFVQDSRGERGRTNNATNDRVVAWKSGGFHIWISRLSGGRVILDPRWVSARGGYTTRQGRTILGPRMVACGIPRAVLVWLGTNDSFADPAAMAADIAAIRDMLLAEGITPILATEIPRAGERPGTPRFAGRTEFNRRIRAMESGRVGVIDMVPGLTRPDGSALPDIYLADNPPDNVHFNHKGAYLAGRAIAGWISHHVAAPTRPIFGGIPDLAGPAVATGGVPRGFTTTGTLPAMVRSKPGRIDIAFAGAGASLVCTVPNLMLISPPFAGMMEGGHYVAEWDAILSDPAGIEAIELGLTDPAGAYAGEGMLSTGGPRNSNMLGAGAVPLPEGFAGLLRTPVLRATASGAGRLRIVVSGSVGPGMTGGRLSLIGAPRLYRIPDPLYRAIDDGLAQRRWQILIPQGASGGGTDVALAGIDIHYRDGADLADVSLNQSGSTPAMPGTAAIGVLDDDPATIYRCAAGRLAGGPVMIAINSDIPIRVGTVGLRAIDGADWAAVSPTALRIRNDPSMSGAYRDVAPPRSDLRFARGQKRLFPV